MKAVRVMDPRGESLLDQLVSLYLTFKGVRGKVVFDISGVSWVFPLLILPIASYIHDTHSGFIPPSTLEVRSYLEHVFFPEGVYSIEKIKRGRSYIPITLLKGGDHVERERLQGKVDRGVGLANRIPKPKQPIDIYPFLEG